MTIVAVIFVPLILVYQGWSYHVFRSRVRAPRSTPEAALQAPAAEQRPES